MSAIEAFTTPMIITFSVSVSLTSAPSLDFNESTLPSAFSIVPLMRMVCAVAAEHDAAIIAPASTNRIVLVISFPRSVNARHHSVAGPHPQKLHKSEVSQNRPRTEVLAPTYPTYR